MKMKQIEQGNSLSPPPPPPPLPRFWDKKAVPESVTKQEIARFWCQKRINEEEHLLAAIKAAACIRALNLSEEDYRRFKESLNNDGKDDKDSSSAANDSNKKASDNEIRVGIKDWWTKSKHAYFNQPAIESSVDPPKRMTSTFVPNCFA
ncbi:uncharacterized protein [Pyrus communis]|uniref:uncharacterized protein n=1 Tax=Pyrus communis TaxID=23211 RepID=UPI0035C13ABF